MKKLMWQTTIISSTDLRAFFDTLYCNQPEGSKDVTILQSEFRL